MSRLFVMTRTELVAGFQLAGVEAFGIEDMDAAEKCIDWLLDSGEYGLLAIEEGIIENLDRKRLQRLENAENMAFIVIPGADSSDKGTFRRRRISELARRVIGFHSIFRSEEPEGEES